MGGELPAEIDAKTSAIPFVALFSGEQPWSALVTELKGLNTALAVSVALLMAARRRAGIRRLLQAEVLKKDNATGALRHSSS